jgi:hypothetical protein
MSAEMTSIIGVAMPGLRAGSTTVPGVGLTAVGIEGAAFTGGGYIIDVLDAKGDFGVSILGKEGNRDRAVALAELIETHR